MNGVVEQAPKRRAITPGEAIHYGDFVWSGPVQREVMGRDSVRAWGEIGAFGPRSAEESADVFDSARP